MIPKYDDDEHENLDEDGGTIKSKADQKKERLQHRKEYLTNSVFTHDDQTDNDIDKNRNKSNKLKLKDDNSSESNTDSDSNTESMSMDDHTKFLFEKEKELIQKNREEEAKEKVFFDK
eukprot:CAMPEP_0116913210 /NCGR_PEP_ID=MMETSP0467-20121206/16559_1 /TAXON_ID=283647 /ORGANISM="Mesodinium pulex, Strain SPMC105" /LENGTH=117 /DNA_ID=CAMNT_0004589363 /DNA_START=582 /DNA_END=935 /DNA_ORIENTATION=-